MNADELTASQLWAAGFRIVSRRHWMVARVPPCETGRQALDRVSPGYHPLMPEENCADQYRRVYAPSTTLDRGTWFAFLKLHQGELQRRLEPYLEADKRRRSAP